MALEPSRALADRAGRAPLPPGPHLRWWGLELLGPMQRDYLGFVCGLQRDWGDAAFTRIALERTCDVFAPELVRAVLVDYADAFVRWERGAAILSQGFGRSVLTSEGETWKRQRRLLAPEFAPARLQGYAGLMVAAARRALDRAAPASEAAQVEVEALMTALAMDVVLRTLFGSTTDEDAAQAADAVQLLSRVAAREMLLPATLPDWLPLPGKAAKRRALRALTALIRRQIRQCRRAADCRDAPAHLMGTLSKLRDENGRALLTDTELEQHCLVLLRAGHETTAAALIWWCRLIAEHPDEARRLRDEVDRVLSGRDPAVGDVPGLAWVAASLQEAMRLYPPVAALMTRRALREVQIGPWRIPRGALVRITPLITHRDARAFPDPEAFRPERFAPGAAPPPRGAFLPFSAGPRVCLGQHYAMLEMVLVATMLLQRYELQVPPGEARPELELGVTVRPRGGLLLRFVRRRDPA
ncbi:MAG: cytochrome P450 [Burkholderiaceae bacterium]|nr:cytochrome P450 [Burkholderiaceae bacterium]